jgi:hypothetical protein
MKRIAKKNSNFISVLKKEIEEAAEFAGVDFETAVDILDNFFFLLKRNLGDPRFPQIRLGKFGVFTTTIGAIRNSIRASILSYRTNPTLETKSLLIDKITRLWKVRNRLILANENISDDYRWSLKRSKSFKQEEAKRMLGDKYSLYYNEDGTRIKYNRFGGPQKDGAKDEGESL